MRRSELDAVFASRAPLWTLCACVALARASASGPAGTTPSDSTGTGTGTGTEDPRRARVVSLALALAFLALATRAFLRRVTRETILATRGVGARISANRGGGDARVLELRRGLRDVLVNEAATSSTVYSYLCFRVRRDSSGTGAGAAGERDELVVGFKALRPRLELLRRVYAVTHGVLFGDGEEGEAEAESEEEEAESVEEEEEEEGGVDVVEERRAAAAEGPTRGLGWWGHGDAWGGDGSCLYGPWNANGRDADVARARRQSVLFVCDFFPPRSGGVETHLYSLAQRLITRGHKVTVLTHACGDRHGVRYVSGGLKVYYAPRRAVYEGCTFPSLFGGFFPLLRCVLIRERVTVVHAHTAFSVMAHEAVLHARTMGYKCVFTDHSLAGFDSAASIHVNKFLSMTLADCAHVICVSHTAKENTVLRASVPPGRVSVIPNAVDAARFRPDASARDATGRVTVAVAARLTHRKGSHLLAATIPLACASFPRVDFLIAGDGPMRADLDRMIAREGLSGRVRMLGTVPHAKISEEVLRRSHAFLSCSLTESFGVAMLEAACSGCLVVATNVGGVPEVLPPDLLFLAETDPGAIVDALSDALDALGGPGGGGGGGGGDGGGGRPDSGSDSVVDPVAIHERVAAMYSWDDVAARVETVYERAHATRDTLYGRVRRLRLCGVVAGVVFVVVAAVDYLYWRALELARPARDVEIAPDFVPDDGAFDVVRGTGGEEEEEEEEDEEED